MDTECTGEIWWWMREEDRLLYAEDHLWMMESEVWVCQDYFIVNLIALSQLNMS